MKKKLRLYLDTSVFGGYYDPEFEKFSRIVINGLFKHQAKLIIVPSLQMSELMLLHKSGILLQRSLMS
jgi:hypothetical protein